MKRIAITLALVGSLAACDGGGSSVNAPVAATNTPPEIDRIGDLSVAANSQSAPITFGVDDDQTAPDALLLAAESDNPALVGDEGLVFSGSGADRTLVVTPRENQTGTAVITLTVTDAQQLTASSSFTLTVTPQSAEFSATVRAIFNSDENARPREINALEFRQDGDNFDDLVAP